MQHKTNCNLENQTNKKQSENFARQSLESQEVELYLANPPTFSSRPVCDRWPGCVGHLGCVLYRGCVSRVTDCVGCQGICRGWEFFWLKIILWFWDQFIKVYFIIIMKLQTYFLSNAPVIGNTLWISYESLYRHSRFPLPSTIFKFLISYPFYLWNSDNSILALFPPSQFPAIQVLIKKWYYW